MREDLITTARQLAGAVQTTCRSDLARAVSTAYYALFHVCARQAADLLVGAPESGQGDRAWRQVYRALDHSKAKRACADIRNQADVSDAVKNFADCFIDLQIERHEADYSPDYGVSHPDALAVIERSENAIKDFLDADEMERRYFIVQLLFSRR